MARPQKDNLEYFSHDVGMRNDKKLKAVRSRFGIMGYAVYNMLLECIAEESGLRLKNSQFEIEVLAGDFGISSEELNDMIKYFSIPELNLIQIVDGFIVCVQLEKRHEHVFKKRGKSVEYVRNGVSGAITGVSGAETQVSGAESTHRIEENRIEEKRIKKINKKSGKSSGYTWGKLEND